jgi:NAD-dependent dihydropyrimidine dehydrogenase PreA subunit
MVAQATRLPILGKWLGRFFFDGDNMVYLPRDAVVYSAVIQASQDEPAQEMHGAVIQVARGDHVQAGSNGASKGRVVEVRQSFDLPEDVVLPSQVVDHFIDQASDLWIMNACLCRQSEGCEDYPIDIGCLFMGRAVREINPALGRLVTREEAKAHVRRAREAGLVHLIGRNKLDSMWLGAGPGHQLLTVCNCCPCCCLFRVLPHLDELWSSKITRLPGVQVRVTDRCVGCGACTQDVCFVDAIQMVELEHQAVRAQIGEGCVGCGRCVDVCPQQAIELLDAEGPLVEQAIARISPSIDIT